MKYFILFISLFMSACSLLSHEGKSPYKILNEYPHDTGSFTEGLFWHEGMLFESTAGLSEYPGTKSEFGIVDLKTGKLESKSQIDEKIYFGEGITILDNKLYQATYKNQKIFVFDTKTWKKIDRFSYENLEGWGLTNDGKNIIMSDGTAKLTFFNPKNFQVEKTLTITKNGTPIKNINELEYVDGFIFANIWLTNKIIKIDAKTGKIVDEFDFSKIAEKQKSEFPDSLEMNGIAYNPQKKTFWITGKFWGKVYEIEIK